MTDIFNRVEQKEKRRKLRRDNVPAEARLWQRLRAGQVGGWKFRRQYSIGPYIVDFYCPRLRLVIEIDGPTHEGIEVESYDANRQAYLESLGLCVLRFQNQQVYSHLDSVVETIAVTAERLGGINPSCPEGARPS
jgi:very-short-patch-repair endonuclease